MSDDLTITPGAGATLRAIDIGGKLFQSIADAAFDDDGWSIYSLVSAGSGDAHSVSATASTLHAIVAVNINASARYLKIYDTASTPTAGSGTPVLRIPLTGGATGIPVVIPNINAKFTSGIGITLVTGITDAGSTGVTASETLVNLFYKAQ